MNAATPVTPPVRAPQIVDPAKYEGKTACVIGSGFGGMALAIRLQSAGITTTVIEARDKPGGRAYFWEKDGFTFDGGPYWPRVRIPGENHTAGHQSEKQNQEMKPADPSMP